MPYSLTHLEPTTRLAVVIAISASFFCAEITVGFYTHSLALIADAFHYLNDVVSFVVALAAIRVTKQGSTSPSLSFGWQRAQLLGAFFNGVFLAALGLSIFVQALERFINVTRVEQPLLVMIVGAVGLTLNIISVLFLHDHGHDHGDAHGHAQSQNILGATEAAVKGSETEGTGVHANHRHFTNAADESSHRDLGMLGVLIHLIGDALNNIGVMGAAAAIQWGKSDGRFYADPAISMAISFMIFATSISLIKNSGKILLQSSPVGVDLQDVKKDLEGLPGVSSVHELHIWSLDQRKRVASAHIVSEDASMEGFLQNAKQVGECLHAYGVHSYTLQPELKVSADDGFRFVNDEARGREEVRQSLEMGELRRREVSCQLTCGEDQDCKELQCCK